MPKKLESKTVRDEITPFSERGDVITIRSTPPLDKAIDEFRNYMVPVEMRLISRAEAVRRLIVLGLGTVHLDAPKDPTK